MNILDRYKDFILAEGIGPYWNHRYEILERYFYYEKDKKVYSYKLICWSSSLDRAREMFNLQKQEKIAKVSVLPILEFI